MATHLAFPFVRQILLVSLILVTCASGFARDQDPDPKADPVISGRPLAYWIKALDDSEALVREEAILVLGAAGPVAKPAAVALTILLGDEQPKVRIQSAFALGKIGGWSKEATAVLLNAWKEGDSQARVQMLPLLESLAAESSEVMVLLLEASVAADKSMSGRVNFIIAKLGPAATGALAKLLDNPNPVIRRQAMQRLEQLHPVSRALAPALTARLTDPDWETRVSAAILLWPLGAQRDRLVPMMIEAAEKPDSRHRYAAVRHLLRLKPRPKEALAAFRLALKEEDPMLRVQAAGAVWELGKQAAEVLPIYLALLQKPDGKNNELLFVRQEAVRALADMGAEAAPARKVLLEMMKNLSNETAEAIPPVLGKLGPESIPALIDLMKGTDLSARDAAIRTLGLIGKEAAGPLTKLLEHPDRNTRFLAANALRMMGAEARAALPVLRKALKSKDSDTRFLGLFVLARLGPAGKEALTDLYDIAGNDPEDAVRAYALRALAYFQTDDKFLRLVLNDGLSYGEGHTRIAAAYWLWDLDQNKGVTLHITQFLPESKFHRDVVRLLTRMGPAGKDAVPALAALLENGPTNLAISAAQTLEQIGPVAKQAVPALLKTLEKADPALRVAAARALRAVHAEEEKAFQALLEVFDKAPANFRTSTLLPALQQFGPAAKEALPRLRPLLAASNVGDRLGAAELMLAIDPGQIEVARPMLQEILKSPYTYLSVRAAVSLWRADPKDDKAYQVIKDNLNEVESTMRHVVPILAKNGGLWAKPLIPALLHCLEDASPYLRIHIAQALHKIEPGHKVVVPTLLAALKDKSAQNSFTFAEVAAALADLGPAAMDAVPLLQAALRSPEGNIRSSANEALRKISPKAALPGLME